jgi:hypothetical protein
MFISQPSAIKFLKVFYPAGKIICISRGSGLRKESCGKLIREGCKKYKKTRGNYLTFIDLCTKIRL